MWGDCGHHGSTYFSSIGSFWYFTVDFSKEINQNHLHDVQSASNFARHDEQRVKHYMQYWELNS